MKTKIKEKRIFKDGDISSIIRYNTHGQKTYQLLNDTEVHYEYDELSNKLLYELYSNGDKKLYSYTPSDNPYITSALNTTTFNSDGVVIKKSKKIYSTKDNINKLTEEEYDIENNIYTTKYVNLNISRKTSDALTLIHDMDSNELLSYKRVNKESFSEHINDELISEEIKEIQFADESNKLMDFPLVNSVCRFFQYNNNLSGDRQLENIVEISCNNISYEPFKRVIDIEYDECGRKIKEISSSGNYTEYEYYEM